jgi:hypothetical protein
MWEVARCSASSPARAANTGRSTARPLFLALDILILTVHSAEDADCVAPDVGDP